MLGILYFIIGIPVDVVGQETDRLHVREEQGRIRQVLFLHRRQEDRGRFQVSLGKGLENLHVKPNPRQVLVVLGTGIGSRAQEVSEIRENEARHHGIQIDYAENLPVCIEQHVVHLGVAVADAFGKGAFAVHPFRLAHLLLERLDLRYERLDGGIGHPPGCIGCNRFPQLTRTQFHVVEIRDGLAQLVGNIGQHRLKMPERLAGIVGILRIHGLVRERVADEHRDAPVGLAIGPVGLAASFHGDEAQDLAVDVAFSGGFQFAADMARNRLDIALEQIDILEDGVVDALEDIILGTVGFHLEGIVDKTVAQRLDFLDCSVNLKLRNDSGEFLLRFHRVLLISRKGRLRSRRRRSGHRLRAGRQ